MEDTEQGSNEVKESSPLQKLGCVVLILMCLAVSLFVYKLLPFGRSDEQPSITYTCSVCEESMPVSQAQAHLQKCRGRHIIIPPAPTLTEEQKKEFERRVRELMEKEGLTEEEARKKVLDTLRKKAQPSAP